MVPSQFYQPCRLKSTMSFECSAHHVVAEDIMVKDMQCLTINSTYGEAHYLLKTFSFKSFPLVDSRGRTAGDLSFQQASFISLHIDKQIECNIHKFNTLIN